MELEEYLTRSQEKGEMSQYKKLSRGQVIYQSLLSSPLANTLASVSLPHKAPAKSPLEMFTTFNACYSHQTISSMRACITPVLFTAIPQALNKYS